MSSSSYQHYYSRAQYQYPQYHYPSAPQVARPTPASTSSNASNSSATSASKRVRFDIPSPASATATTGFAQQQAQAQQQHQRRQSYQHHSSHSKSTSDAFLAVPQHYTRPRVVSAPSRPTRRPSMSGVTLHPYLQHPGHNRPPAIAFNVANESSTIRVIAPSSYTSAVPLSSHDRAQPASHPPCPRLTIRAPSLFPWTIDVRPANATSTALPYVTCGDVFDAIYHAFHERLRHAEWNACDKPTQSEIASYFRKRCRLSKGWEKWEEQQGVRRIDWMKEKTMFVGLVSTLDKDVFEIVLARAA